MKPQKPLTAALLLLLLMPFFAMCQKDDISNSDDPNDNSGSTASGVNRYVGSDTELTAALASTVVYDTIFINNGTYTSFNAQIAKSGTAQNPLVIAAQTPGSVIFTEDVSFLLSGEYITLSDFYFNDSSFDNDDPIIEITGDNNRVTQSAFFNCNGRVSIQSIYQSSGDRMPQYTHIDHCYFADNLAKYVYLDLGRTPTSPDLKYAMYYRVNNCYFSTPFKMNENTGSAMRIGLGEAGYYGRCVVDRNLFEHQSGESELIENKSSENLYIYNTFKNCESDMSFRQGHRTAFIHNHLFGDDSDRPSGALSMWMDDAVIAGNYFSYPYGSYVPLNANMNQQSDRAPAAVVRFNCGYTNTITSSGDYASHLAAQNNTFANNLFYHCADYLFNMIYVKYNMDTWGSEATVPFDNLIVDNDVISGTLDNSDYIYKNSDFETKNNVISNLRFVDASTSPLNASPSIITHDLLTEIEAWLPSVPGSDKDYSLNILANLRPATYSLSGDQVTISLRNEPLSFNDVGPDWLTENPSQFAQDGVYTTELIATIKELLGL